MSIGYTRLITSIKLAIEAGIFSLLLFLERGIIIAMGKETKHSLSEGHKERLREKVILGAKNFEKYLNDKCFKIICDDNSETIVRFFQYDFMHLSGIESNLSNHDFYNKCLHSTISTGNILSEQKYNWATLKSKTDRIEIIHELLYTDADKTLLLNDLAVHTTNLPVAIRNDHLKTCIGFMTNINKARSLRKASTSQGARVEKKIIAIYGKKNGTQEFSEVVYEAACNT